MPVSEEFRKEHTYWVRRRNAWRKQYHAVRDEIKFYKDEVNFYNRDEAPWLAKRSMLVVTSLRMHADKLMQERVIISQRLKETAYRYE